MHGAGADPLTRGSGEQYRLPFVLMRGGTSKAVFVHGSALPPAGQLRDRLILALFGSPDPRQIDGLGGADLLTSKLAIIDPPTRADADLDYTFAQVSISEPVVDYDINCGNISAAVGAFAVDEGMVGLHAPTTTVRVHNTNTGTILLIDVPIVDGRAAVAGTCSIEGVPGTGAPIALDFSATAGGATGALLPTGNESDVLDTAVGPVTVTIVDLANLTVFIAAAAVGMLGTEGPGDLTDDHLHRVSTVKAAAAGILGMRPDGLTPVPAIVSAPADYVAFSTGAPVGSGDVDLVARVVAGRPAVLHKAYPGTLAACTGVAARIAGTTVHDAARRERPDVDEIRIGHTSGVMTVKAGATRSGGVWQAERAAYQRTARRLAEGSAFVPRGACGHGDSD